MTEIENWQRLHLKRILNRIWYSICKRFKVRISQPFFVKNLLCSTVNFFLEIISVTSLFVYSCLNVFGFLLPFLWNCVLLRKWNKGLTAVFLTFYCYFKHSQLRHELNDILSCAVIDLSDLLCTYVTTEFRTKSKSVCLLLQLIRRVIYVAFTWKNYNRIFLFSFSTLFSHRLPNVCPRFDNETLSENVF